MIDEKYGSSRQQLYGGGAARIIIAAAEAATTYPELMVVVRAGGQRGDCIGAPSGGRRAWRKKAIEHKASSKHGASTNPTCGAEEEKN